MSDERDAATGGTRIGRLEGRLDALKEKVDGMDRKLDTLLTREDERAGADRARKEIRDQVSRREARRLAVLSALGGGSIATAIQVLGRKLGWGG